MAGGVVNGQKCDAPTLNGAFKYSDFETTARGTSFTIANNQSASANVTGLVMDHTNWRMQKLDVVIYRKSTGGGAVTRVQGFSVMCWWDDTQWNLTMMGGSSLDAGVLLDINPSTGQVIYTSDNQAGTYAAGTSYMKYQVVNTMGL